MSRTDFEAAYIERYGHRPRGWSDDFQVYQDAHANGAWFGWQAGAAGIEAKAAPVGEREAFEAWLGITPCGAAHNLAVKAFQAGAAYQRQQVEYGDAYQGAREDLAIWKRRALEAEARVRQQDQIIDQMGEDLNAINGPTFMGEPVLPRQQAREVVMPGADSVEDARSILCDMIAGIESRGNYSKESTLLFLNQALGCLDEFARLNKGAGSHE